MTLHELICHLHLTEEEASKKNISSHSVSSWEVVIDSTQTQSPRSIEKVVFDTDARLITLVHKYESNAAKRKNVRD